MGHSPSSFSGTLVRYHPLDVCFLQTLEEHPLHQDTGLPEVSQLGLGDFNLTIFPTREFPHKLTNVLMVLSQSGLPLPL